MIDVFAATAEEKPPICTSSSVNYTDFIQVLLYFLHVTHVLLEPFKTSLKKILLLRNLSLTATVFIFLVAVNLQMVKAAV